MRKATLTLVLTLAIALVMSTTSIASGATGIAGRGSGGGWTVQVSAQLTPSGAHGMLSLCKVCAGGPVFQIVPPSATSDHWCIAAHRDDGPGNEMLYIRDVGDGKTTFDQFSFTSTFAPADCTTFPDPFQYLTLDTGDFHSH